ncbi:hypothetical protein Chor_011414, partial [Crotalus horridus]
MWLLPVTWKRTLEWMYLLTGHHGNRHEMGPRASFPIQHPSQSSIAEPCHQPRNMAPVSTETSSGKDLACERSKCCAELGEDTEGHSHLFILWRLWGGHDACLLCEEKDFAPRVSWNACRDPMVLLCQSAQVNS